jgi:hypothetical protein
MPTPIEYSFFTINNNGFKTEEIVEIPTVWVICDECKGEGQSSAHLGVLSEEDEQDYEFMELYSVGAYDKPCKACNALGRKISPDEAWLDANPSIRDRYEQDLKDKAAYDAECRAERRYLGY